jgi:hypothetical protein
VGLVALLCAVTPLAWADGTITHLSGLVSVRLADGRIVPGAPGVKVTQGDTAITGAGGYVRIEMSDGGEMVLRPNAALKIEAYSFEPGKPESDSFIFSMLRGGLRTVSGLISKRGDKDAYKLRTATATIGIRGTQFDLRVCQADCGTLADGTYVAVKSGAVQAANTAGNQLVSSGQVAFVPPILPPIILPRDPGVGFTPPPVIPKLDEKKKIQQQEQQQNAPAPTGGATDAPKPEAKPDASKPEATKPDATKGDANKPDASKPDGNKSDASKGDANKPAVSTSQSTSPSQSAAGNTQDAGAQDCFVE